jgi:hypothetical protein
MYILFTKACHAGMTEERIPLSAQEQRKKAKALHDAIIKLVKIII